MPESSKIKIMPSDTVNEPFAQKENNAFKSEHQLHVGTETKLKNMKNSEIRALTEELSRTTKQQIDLSDQKTLETIQKTIDSGGGTVEIPHLDEPRPPEPEPKTEVDSGAPEKPGRTFF